MYVCINECTLLHVCTYVYKHIYISVHGLVCGYVNAHVLLIHIILCLCLTARSAILCFLLFQIVTFNIIFYIFFSLRHILLNWNPCEYPSVNMNTCVSVHLNHSKRTMGSSKLKIHSIHSKLSCGS